MTLPFAIKLVGFEILFALFVSLWREGEYTVVVSVSGDGFGYWLWIRIELNCLTSRPALRRSSLASLRASARDATVITAGVVVVVCW